jgi:hypothetical protein
MGLIASFVGHTIVFALATIGAVTVGKKVYKWYTFSHEWDEYDIVPMRRAA